MYENKPLDYEQLEDSCNLYGDNDQDIFELYYNDPFVSMTTDLLHKQQVKEYGYIPTFDFIIENENKILYSCYKYMQTSLYSAQDQLVSFSICHCEGAEDKDA